MLSLALALALCPVLQQDEPQPEVTGIAQEPQVEDAQEPSKQEPIAQEPGKNSANPFSHIDPEETLTINFKDQDLASVLEMFATNYALNLVYGQNVQGKVTINLYQAPVASALLQVLASNGYTYLVEDGFLLVVDATEVRKEVVVSGIAFEPLVIYLNHLRASDALPLLTPLLAGNERLLVGPKSEDGLQVTDKLGGNNQATQEMMVLYASPETRQRIEALLAEIDVAPLQVLVEATILAVSLSDENKLGVDFRAMSGIDFQAMGGTSDLTDRLNTDSVAVGGQNNWLLGARTGGFTTPGGDGLHIGILRNQIGVFVEALERVGNATVLSNPQVLTVNRHVGTVLVGQRLPYLVTTSNETATLQSVDFLEVGTSLTFRPFISADGWVRMEINPKNSSGLINDLGLPEETTTQVTSNVLVRSGNTVVIGGLMETQETTDNAQVPFLGSIPFIGALFRSQTERETKREIIVLLTPHVINDGELERRAAEARHRFDAARARLASSHHGYLRPSYARRMYREAALLLAQGDPAAALAKAEWGLRAMPADPDLALLAEHCHDEVLAAIQEHQELEDALRIVEPESER